MFSKNACDIHRKVLIKSILALSGEANHLLTL